jgi:membrane-bound lytic murein transglycosylase D
MLIKSGSTLLVPRAGTMTKDVTVQVADHGHVVLAPEAVTRRTTVKARKGDSVASVAGRNGLSASSVAGWNNLSVASLFKVGQPVVLFLPVKASKSPSQRGTAKIVKKPRR